MRRKDREISDNTKINETIENCYCCRIAFDSSEGIYIVPLNFGYEVSDGRYTFYFHSAHEGRKSSLLSKILRLDLSLIQVMS